MNYPRSKDRGLSARLWLKPYMVLQTYPFILCAILYITEDERVGFVDLFTVQTRHVQITGDFIIRLVNLILVQNQL